MSDDREQPRDGHGPADPWAPPPRDGVELSKSPTPPTPPAHDRPTAPPAHDQPTVASMPGVPAPGGDVPPPPIAPGGAVPGAYGHPAAPGGYGHPAAPGGYGYPTAPVPPAGYGHPGYPGYPAYGPLRQQSQNNGMGTAAMVLGILAVVLSVCSYGIMGLILGGIALPLGIVARKKSLRGEADNRGQAVAGIALGSVGIVLGIAGIVLIAFLVTHADEWDDSPDDPWSTSRVSVGALR
ncbi:DUF4190 domain-containing protein [Streptomyces sp. NPDC001744]|uniref:DUF4190 domain-containing protein n=1 Tax=Streptomyces sp. NPDC001744 TaxID=3364606 RepID=UPI0036C67289